MSFALTSRCVTARSRVGPIAPIRTPLALIRSMLTHPEAAEHFRTATAQQVGAFAAAIRGPDAQLRASLLVATSLGLTEKDV